MRHNHCYSWQKLSGILWDSWPSCYVQRCHTMQCVTISFSLGWSKIQPGYVRTARISTGTSTAVQFTYCNTCEYWVVLNLHTANTFQFGTSTSIYTATQDSNSGNAKGMHHNTVWLILLSNPLFHVAMETADGSITYMECHRSLYSQRLLKHLTFHPVIMTMAHSLNPICSPFQNSTHNNYSTC